MKGAKRNITLTITLAVLDQIIKSLVNYHKPTLDFFIFSIHEIRNTGASFGIFAGNNTPLIFVSMIALGAILYNIKKITEQYQIPLSLITAGILGNLTDRIFRGYVIDYFDLGWWPAFNIADSCIFVGVFWLIILLIKDEKKSEKKPIPPVKSKRLKKKQSRI